MALSDSQVSLIKAMLARRMRNKDIQFYFNTPQNPVNNGRISEIKSRHRWAHVIAASEFELDQFIENHPLTEASRSVDEPRLPEQSPAASVFTVLDSGVVDVVPDPLVAGRVTDPDQVELYGELISKVDMLISLGQNALGIANRPVIEFKEALAPDFRNTSVVKMWTRGNALRAILRAHDGVAHSSDYPLGRLETLCAELLRDVVEIFNVLIAGDPKGLKLDQARIGPDQRQEFLEAVDNIQPVIDDAEQIATGEASAQLRMQAANAALNHEGLNGEQALATAVGSASNFFLTLLKKSFWFLKRTISGDIAAVFKAVRYAGYTYVGAQIMGSIPPAMSFLAKHAPSVHSFLEKISVNETLLQVLNFVVSAVTG